MMQIYLVHARHGKKIAMQINEAEADKKNGWKEVTQEEFFPKKAEPKKAEKDEALSAQYEAKFGKKPHHRMTDTSISEALNDPAA